MSNQQEPLVSIIVITYNSSKYVLETLESCKNQTYKNIELIISDDASKDNTIEICEDWLKKNSDRFVRIKLLKTEINTGIPSNCNRGLHESKGKWIKLIAGDDILFEDNVYNNINFALENNYKFIASDVLEFNAEGETWNWEIPDKFLELETAQDQYHYFLGGVNYLSGGALFFKKETIDALDGFDERYPLVEDRPLLLKVTYNGIFIGCLNRKTIKHRRHSLGLTAKNKQFLIPEYIDQVYNCVLYYSQLSSSLLFRINAKWHLYMISKIRKSNKPEILNIIRDKFQPIRLLWLKRIYNVYFGKNIN